MIDGLSLMVTALAYGLIIELFLTAKPRRKPMSEARAKELING